MGHSSAELRLGQNLLEIPVQGMNTYCNMTCAHLLVSMRVMTDLFIRTRSVRSMQHKTPCLLQVGMRLPGLRPSHACCRRRLLPHLVVVACPLGVCGRAVHGAVERPRPAAKVEREHATAALASCSAALPSQVRLGQFLAACSQVWQVRSMSLRLACDLPWLSSCVGYTARLN